MVGHRQKLMSQLDKLAVLRDGALEAFGPTAAVLPRLAALARPSMRLSVVSPASLSEAHS
jgi:ABC-type protease/lipase transport system fused ATPase/permease subunit